MTEIPRLEPADRMISGSEWETIVYLETEQNPGGYAPSNVECKALIRRARPPVRGVRSSLGHFLETGGLVYVDVGNHIELATPEETTPEGAVQRELDDERFMTGTLENAVNDPMSNLIGAAVYRRTYSSGRRLIRQKDGSIIIAGHDGAESCGRHVNTGLPRRAGQTGIGREHLGAMGLHAATNGLFLGAGAVFAHDPSGVHARFGLHQRAPFVDNDFSMRTTTNRPVINLRDEPLVPSAMGGEWMRFHDINADACLSPWAMRMTHGMSRLVLRLGLAGESFEEYEPTRTFPLQRIFKQTAFDLSHKKSVELWNGTITPLQIQQVLFEKCNQLQQRYDLPEGELWTLREWKRALEDFEEDPELLRDRTDWVQKLRTLQNYKRKNDIPENDWTHPILEAIDNDFSLLKPGSRGMKMRAGPWRKWLPTTELNRTDEQRRTPPQDTRARIRGEVVRQYGDLPCDVRCSGCANCDAVPKNLNVEWTSLAAGRFTDETGRDARVRIAMQPFDTDTSVLEAIAAIKPFRGLPQTAEDVADFTNYNRPVGETWL